MSTKDEKYKMAEILVYNISDLLRNFIDEMELPMTIQVGITRPSTKETYIEDVERIVNGFVPIKYREKGLRTKIRKMDLILYKHVTFYILREKKFGPSEIADHFNDEYFRVDHATVIHAHKKIRDHLETGHQKTIEVYKILLTAIDEGIKNERTIQVNSGQQPDA